MASQSSGASQPAEFKCDLCGKVCQRAYTLTKHEDSNVCKAEQARQARRPAQPTSSNNPDHSLPANLSDLLLHSKKNRPTLRCIPAGAGKPDDDAIRKQIDLKFQDGDISGAVRLLASEDTIAPANEETLAALKQKHPSPPRDLVFPDMTLAPCGLDITVEEVSKALQSFSAGSGADRMACGHNT